MAIATGELKIEKWDEKPFWEGKGGRKLTKVSVKQTYTGDITGTGTTEYLIAYKADGTAYFTGVQRIEGKVGRKQGALVLSLSGTFDGKGAKAKTVIVTGAGEGSLDKLAGKGSFKAPMGDTGTYSLTYE